MASNDLLSLLMSGSPAGSTPTKVDSRPPPAADATTSHGSDPLAMLFDAVRMQQTPLPQADQPKVTPTSPQSTSNGAVDLLSLLTKQAPAPTAVEAASPAARSTIASPPVPQAVPAAAPAPAPAQPSPFAFPSPFDVLHAATSKSRASLVARQEKETKKEPKVEVESSAVLSTASKQSAGVIESEVKVLNLGAGLGKATKAESVPISKFSSELKYSKGRRIACNGLISYSTRAGRIRVIDAKSGARLIKKLHVGLVDDMALSGEVNGRRRLASCSPGRLSIWDVPASFDTDDEPSDLILDISACPVDFQLLAFNPHHSHSLVGLDGAGTIYFLDLTGKYEGSAAANALSGVKQVVMESKTLSFSADGTRIATIGNGTASILDESGELLNDFDIIPDVDSALLFKDRLVGSCEQGRTIHVYKTVTGVYEAIIKLPSGFASIHASQNLIVSSSEGYIYTIVLEPLSIEQIIQAGSEMVQSVLDGDDLFLLHPAGFDKITLGALQVDGDAEAAPVAATRTATLPASVPTNGPQEEMPAREEGVQASVKQAAHLSSASPVLDAPALLQQMQELFLQQAALFETLLLNQQKAEKLRYDQTLQYISDTLTNNTRKMIDASIQSAVRQEVEGRLLPEILRAFNDLTHAVDGAAQTQAFAVKQAAIGTIKSELAGLGPFLEQIDSKISSSSSHIEDLRSMLEQQSLFSAQPADAVVPQPDVEDDVPDVDLEDLFLHGLRQPDAVAVLVDQAPVTRISRAFPPNGRPLLSATNILALTVQLYRSLGADEALSAAEKKRLAWLWACIHAFPYAVADPKSQPFLARIATTVMSSLSERRARLTNLQDVEICSEIIQTVDVMGYV